MSSRRCDGVRHAALLLGLITSLASLGWNLPPPALPSTDAIVARLMAANAHRARALRSYHGKRLYRLEYHGIFGGREAEMQVEAAYVAPDSKTFKVIAQSGSKLLINRVLMKLLESEQEAQQGPNRQELELNPKNYQFAFVEMQHSGDDDFYVLDVTPRGKSKYLYRGRIWVEARDFAVAHIQGEPAKNPSFWTKHTQIEYRWSKIDGFWLPAHNQSVSQVRMGGKAVLTIDYTDYQITGVDRSAATRGTGAPSDLPEPSSVTPDQPH